MIDGTLTDLIRFLFISYIVISLQSKFDGWLQVVNSLIDWINYKIYYASTNWMENAFCILNVDS